MSACPKCHQSKPEPSNGWRRLNFSGGNPEGDVYFCPACYDEIMRNHNQKVYGDPNPQRS